jgi:acyl-CoA oxidase
MARIRPHAVPLVDAWKIPDYLLDRYAPLPSPLLTRNVVVGYTNTRSALGRFDGRVYEDLFNRAHRLNPLNKVTVNPNYWEDEIVKGEEDIEGIRAKL